MDGSTAVWLYEMFQAIYELGDSIILIDLFGVTVTLNNFLLVLAVMGIVLGALLNFARVHGDAVGDAAVASARGFRDRVRHRHGD